MTTPRGFLETPPNQLNPVFHSAQIQHIRGAQNQLKIPLLEMAKILEILEIWEMEQSLEIWDLG